MNRKIKGMQETSMCHCRARASRDGHGVMIPPGCVIIHRAMTRYLVPVILKVCRECPGSHGSRKRRWKLPTYLVIPAMIPGCTVGRTASEKVPVIRRASSMRIWNHSKNNVSDNRGLIGHGGHERHFTGNL
jgi:hypothetical protein